MPRLKRTEREQRDQRVMELFLDGLTYREIGEATGLRSVSGVHRIVQREMKGSAARRGLLTDEAFAIWQERTEALFNAHWDAALDGDHRSAEICRKLLGQQASVYAARPVEKPEPSLPDELARLRAARAKRFAF